LTFCCFCVKTKAKRYNDQSALPCSKKVRTKVKSPHKKGDVSFSPFSTSPEFSGLVSLEALLIATLSKGSTKSNTIFFALVVRLFNSGIINGKIKK
jgi:hypothetical protein